MDLNAIVVSGNLISDPVYRITAKGTGVANFILAVNGRNKNETIFINVVSWGRHAESIARHLKKGSKVLVNGQLIRKDVYNKTPVHLNVTPQTGDRNQNVSFQIKANQTFFMSHHNGRRADRGKHMNGASGEELELESEMEENDSHAAI